MIEVFKIMKGIYDNQCLPPLKLKNELGRTKGHSLQLQMSRSRLELSRTSFCRRVVPIWKGFGTVYHKKWWMQGTSTNSRAAKMVDKVQIKCKFDYQYNIFDEQDIA